MLCQCTLDIRIVFIHFFSEKKITWNELYSIHSSYKIHQFSYNKDLGEIIAITLNKNIQHI